MTLLGNLKIGQRLALALGLMIVLLASICTFAALTAKRLAGELERTAQVDMAQTRAAGDIAAQVATVARASRELLIVDSAGQMKKQREAIAGALTQLESSFAALASDGTLDAARLDAVRSGQAAFKEAVAKYMAAESGGNPDATKAALLIDLKPVQTGFEKALAELRQTVDERAAESAATGQATARTALLSMLGVGLAGTLLGVAGEVRSLAARASGAAREIKTLIDDSAERVADGTETVADVGQRIKGIVAEVMSVRQLIEEVSVAGHEQESGMVSVNRSVTELDQSTQQNAALVEEIAATAESLKSNAKRLVSAVEFFRLPGAPAAA